MDWIEGGDLKKRINEAPTPLDEEIVLPWMRQVCDGMRATAERGIVHRDLKPANILIDNSDRAKVADFGLAKSTVDLSLTGVVGTAYYMAPEQVEDRHNIDTRTDIYGFGATFYHALTGAPPFEGDNPIAIMFKHKMEPLVSPSFHNPSLSSRTSRILERCLAKAPSDRFQSFVDLSRHLAQSPLADTWDEEGERELGDCFLRFKERRKLYLDRPAPTELNDVYAFPNGRSLRILVGDLADQEADVIVNSVSTRLGMHEGVSAAIRDAAGPSVEAELRRFKTVRPGRLAVTSAGDLKARYIFHAVTLGYSPGEFVMPSRDILSEIVAECFRQADAFYATTLALPLLGAGAGRFPEDVCLDTIFRAVARRLLRGITDVREVAIVLRTGVENLRERGRQRPISQSTSSPRRPAVEGYEVADLLLPASPEGGGDFFDYIELPENRVAFVVADLVGHGSQMLFDSAQERREELRRCMEATSDPAAALAELNNAELNRRGDRFLTAVIVVLDHETHSLTIADAGNMCPLLRRIDGTVVELARDDVGLPIGIEEGLEYQSATLDLLPGETVVMCTDGLIECIDDDGRRFGMERLRECMRRTAGSADELRRAIVSGLENFAASNDVCLVCISRK